MHVKLSSNCSRRRHLLTPILLEHCIVDGVKPCLNDVCKPIYRCQNRRQLSIKMRRIGANTRRSGSRDGYLTFTLVAKTSFKYLEYTLSRGGKFLGVLMIISFLNDETGATSVEYGIIATVLSLAIITGVGLLATQISAMWTNNSTVISGGLH